MQTNDLCQTELLEIEQFDHSTMYKQITDVWLSLWWHISVLETI